MLTRLVAPRLLTLYFCFDNHRFGFAKDQKHEPKTETKKQAAPAPAVMPPPPSAPTNNITRSSGQVATSATKPLPTRQSQQTSHQTAPKSVSTVNNKSQPQQVLPRPNPNQATTTIKTPPNNASIQQQQKHVPRPTSSYGRPNTTNTTSCNADISDNNRRVSHESSSNAAWPNLQSNNYQGTLSTSSQTASSTPNTQANNNIYAMAIQNNAYVGQRPPLNNLPTNSAVAASGAAAAVTPAGHDAAASVAGGSKRPANSMNNPYSQLPANPNKSGRMSL